MSKHSSSIFTIVTILLLLVNAADAFAAKKKVYMSYILHGNMNYDRYVRPTIWRDFPIIYDNLLDTSYHTTCNPVKTHTGRH